MIIGMMMQMAVFEAFRKIFQKHLNKDTYNHKNPDIMIFRMVNFWKNFIIPWKRFLRGEKSFI